MSAIPPNENEPWRLSKELNKEEWWRQVEQDRQRRRLMFRALDTVEMRAIEWLWTGWIPQGYITIFAGETGASKTTVVADITARVTTGKSWPGDDDAHTRPPGRVLWLGSEDGIEDMTVPRLKACGADLKRITEIQGVMQAGMRNTFSMQDDLAAVAEALKLAKASNMPFALIVVDPITSYLPGQKLRKVDLRDAGQLRSILEPWLALAQEHNIAIICVTHFNKDETRSMLHRVLGSAAFVQTCRSLCAIVSRDDEGPFEKIMVQVKNNLPEHPGGAWRFRTEKVEVGKDSKSGKPIHATRPFWDALDPAITTSGLMGGTRGPVSKAPETFAMWVRAHFMTTDPDHAGLRCEDVLIEAIRQRACPSKRWWNEHSGEYLEKVNLQGTYWCRPLSR